MSDVYIKVSYELSTKYDKRYVVVDKVTKKVIDDAQGYGYKSRTKAYYAYMYKKYNMNKD